MRISLTLCLLLLCAAHVPAQVSQDSARARAMAMLNLGTSIRLAIGGHEYVGSFAGLDSVDLVLRRRGEYLNVPRQGIQALWVPGGRATLDGLVLGGIIGAIPGGLLGYVYGGMWCESNCRARKISGSFFGAAMGGLAVGAVGAIIGSAFPTWERLFPQD